MKWKHFSKFYLLIIYQDAFLFIVCSTAQRLSYVIFHLIRRFIEDSGNNLLLQEPISFNRLGGINLRDVPRSVTQANVLVLSLWDVAKSKSKDNSDGLQVLGIILSLPSGCDTTIHNHETGRDRTGFVRIRQEEILSF